MSPRGHGGLIGRYQAVRAYLTRRVYAATALWLGAGVAGIMLLAWLIAGPGGWSQGSWGPLGLVLLGVGILAASVGAFRLLPSRWLAERRVARTMERASGLAHGKVVGSLELSRSVPPGVSSTLSLKAQGDVAERLGSSDRHLAGEMGSRTARWIRAGSGSVAVLLPLIVLAALLSPERSRLAWGALVSPLEVLAQPTFPPLSVSPGSVEVPRGSALEIEVTAPVRESVLLHWRAAGDVAHAEERPIVANRASFRVAPVSVPLEYWVEAPDGAVSPVYEVTPVDPLFVSTVDVELTFPPHTGRPPEEFRGEVPPVVVPVGTRFRIEGQASKGIATAGLFAGEVLEHEFRIEGAAFDGDWVPRRSGRYAWGFTDETGAPAEVFPEPMEVTLVRDSVPEIRFAFPAQDTVLPLTLRQPLVLESRDDYGIDRIELVSYRVTSFGEREAPLIQQMRLEGSRAAIARPFLDVSTWDLLPGDTVRYLARVYDNSPRGQMAETIEFALRLPAAAELSREAQEVLDELTQEMEQLAEQAAEASEETRDLERSTDQAREDAPANQVEFADREEVEQALERQQEMMSEVDSLQKELSDLREALREAGMADPELREELEELEGLMEEVSSPELEDQMQQLSEQIEGMDPRSLEEALEELAKEQEAFRQRLEESLEQFRQAAIEQDFRATSQEAEELAQQEDALAEALEEGGDEELRADQQEALEQRAEDLRENIERLEQRLQEAGEQQAQQGAQQAGEQTQQAQQQMSQAAQQARNEEMESAAQQAQDAAQSLQEAAQQLQQAQQSMQQEAAEAMQEALRQTATDALSMARRQGEIREQMRGASAEQLAEMRADEGALAQGIRNLAENFAEATQMAAPGSREVMSSIGEAMEALQNTVDAMEERRGRTPSPYSTSEGVIEALNQAAMMAMASSQQGSSQASASAAEQMMQQLEQMAQQQGELFNQTGQLTPMQLGEEAMANQLQEISGQQEELAAELDELAEEQKMGEDETLGDLESFAEEAMDIAEMLASGRLDPETLRRQERLFHRLLDAGRTLERDEESEERESEMPDGFERADVLPLTPEAMDALRFGLPDPSELRALPPAQRALVLKYFERLNEAAARGRRSAPPPERGNDR